MPYEWVIQETVAPEQSGAAVLVQLPSVEDARPRAELHIWPYRSLPRRGFVIFIAATAALFALPLLAVLGSLVLWGVLPFILAALGLVWWALGRSYRDGELLEVLRLWHDRIELARSAPGRETLLWQANPLWTRLCLVETGGPVPAYMTLRGNGREVELGAFLTEAERRALHLELARLLR